MSLVAAAGVIHGPHIDYTALLPELICIGGALVLLLVGALTAKRVELKVYTGLTAVISAAAVVSSVFLWNVVEGTGSHDFGLAVKHHGPFLTVAHSLVIDGFSTAFVLLASCILFVASFLAHDFLEREQIAGPEYYALALLAASGAMFMAAANDLIVIFLGLEIMSIPLYVLAGLDRRRPESGEAAMKYFVLGAFSSAIFVYGIALTYGATGSTNLAEISAYLGSNVLTSDSLLLAGLALLLVGFGFKVAAVPFHMWTPDVYEGSPTAATGFMAAIAKVGGFAALLRVFFSSFHTLSSDWRPILFVMAIVTLVGGAVLGLVQRDIKRMLAYSSINHAGFILLGLQAVSTAGMAASLYYVFVYAFLVLGSFAIVGLVGGRGDATHEIEGFRGLSKRQPVLALCFAILLLAQTGVPPTTGFWAKVRVVQAAVGAHSYALAVIAMLSGAIAAAFYLRVVFVMYGVGTGAAPLGAPPAGTGGAGVGEAGAGDAPLAPAVEAVAAPGASVAVASTGGGLALATADLDVAVAAGAEGAAEDAEGYRPMVSVPPAAMFGIGLTVAFSIVFGVWPELLFGMAHAARLLF